MDQDITKSFRHVGLVVRNLEKSLSFYQNCFKLRIVSRDTETGPFMEKLVGIPGVILEWVKLQIPGGGLLELLQYHSHPDGKTTSAPQNFPSNRLGCSHVALTVKNLDEVYRLITTCGGSCNSRPLDSPDGRVKVLYAHDPDGIILELVEEK